MHSRFASAEQFANIKAVNAAYPGATRIVFVDCGWVVFLTAEAIDALGRDRDGRPPHDNRADVGARSLML